ncbi:MAG: type II secretion system F family protein [Burkholderiaceae bacterium]|nr:type II secretion system F family protein [Burkholderiaceae bacterium]
MAQFAWYGRDASQQAQTGMLEAASRSLAAQALAASGVVPVAIEPHVPPTNAGDTLRRWLGRRRIADQELLLFTRQMHTLMRAGVPILRALQGLQESSVHDGLREMLGRLRQALDAGHELSQAMAREPEAFDGFFVSMVRVGEGTGQLTEIFDALHHHLDFQRLMREQVESALRYPKFVLIAMVIAVAVINIFVIPAFAKVFANLHTELPLMTRVLLGMSGFFVAAWPLLLAALVVALLGARSFVATLAGRLAWDRWKLRLPIAGKVLRKSALSRACRGLALALKSGVPVLEGLHLAAAVADNAHIERAMLGMRSGVARGESVLAACRRAGIFTPIVLQMVMVGEESGTLDEMLEEIGLLYQREVEYELKTMSQQIEPVLIACLGAMVLVLALGVFMPMWDLGKASLK